MTKLERIEESVASLSDEELKRFAAWFDELRWERWDRELEGDAEAGRLDKLAEQALADLDAAARAPCDVSGPSRQPGLPMRLLL